MLKHQVPQRDWHGEKAQEQIWWSQGNYKVIVSRTHGRFWKHCKLRQKIGLSQNFVTGISDTWED